MAEQDTGKELSEEARLKQLAAKMREAEYKGLSEEEIQEKERQKEDLCRRTSLLLSLESDKAKKYYEYNNARKTRMGSDAIMLSPNVEVIKDISSKVLPAPFQISVMSCAAPMVRLGLEGMSQQEYEAMLYKRIQGMLLVAAS